MSNVNIEYGKSKYKGAWKSNTDYEKHDLVHVNGGLWQALIDLTSSPTFDDKTIDWLCCSCIDNRVEKGFNLSVGSPGPHVYIGGDTARVEQVTVNGSQTTAAGHVTSLYNDLRLKYYEYEILSGLPLGGFGVISTTTGVGLTNGSVGYSPGSGSVTHDNIQVATATNSLSVGDYMRFWTRGGDVWVGSYSTIDGYEIIGGGNPYLNTSPTVSLGVTNYYRPLVTCFDINSGIRLSTVGNFDHPPLPQARPWDS